MNNNTLKKSPGLFDWVFWLITRFVGWLIMGAIGCIAVAVLIVTLKGEQAGFTQLQALAETNYSYLANHASPMVLTRMIHWLYSIPNDAPYTLLTAALLGVKLLIMRLYLLLRWCPLFLIIGIVGLVDGVAQRHIRRANAERESALIYHNAKPLIMLSLILGIFVALLLPVSATATQWIVVSASILFGIAIQVTANRFKKYL